MIPYVSVIKRESGYLPFLLIPSQKGEDGTPRHWLTNSLTQPSISNLNISGSPSSSRRSSTTCSGPPPPRSGEELNLTARPVFSTHHSCPGARSRSESTSSEPRMKTSSAGGGESAPGVTNRCGLRRGVDPLLLYCAAVAAAPPTRPYFSTTTATFLASSSASTLVAASA